MRLRQAQRQRNAIEAIEKVGGIVLYDIIQDEPPPRAFVTELVSGNFLSDYVSIHLASTEVDDSVMPHLKAIPTIDWLRLDGTNITDAGLVNLASLRNMEILSLSGTRITDAGLEDIGGLSRLERLDLSRTQVTDDGLQHRTGLANLSSLHLESTKVTAKGVNELRDALPHCTTYWTSCKSQLEDKPNRKSTITPTPP